MAKDTHILVPGSGMMLMRHHQSEKMARRAWGKKIPKFPNTIETMFDGPDFPKSLDEDTFNRWLENGRQSKIGYEYLMVVWDEFESAYRPIYASRRDELGQYDTERTASSREWLVAAYNLYSESRVI